jgi:hypothetical protein
LGFRVVCSGCRQRFCVGDSELTLSRRRGAVLTRGGDDHFDDSGAGDDSNDADTQDESDTIGGDNDDSGTDGDIEREITLERGQEANKKGRRGVRSRRRQRRRVCHYPGTRAEDLRTRATRGLPATTATSPEPVLRITKSKRRQRQQRRHHQHYHHEGAWSWHRFCHRGQHRHR